MGHGELSHAEVKRSDVMVYEVKKYSWREGWTPKLSADIVGKVVSDIEAKKGTVTKEALLDASRSSKSPTHSLFEWDDHKAAESYRLSVASRVITQLQIEVIKEESEDKLMVPAFINVNSERDSKYLNIVDALSNEESKELIIERLRREVKAFVERNKHIDELVMILQEGIELLTR